MLIAVTQPSITSASNIPQKKKPIGLLRIVTDTKEFLRISNVNGGLVPQSSVATILGVSRQRVHQLVSEGTFSTWTFYGMKWLSQQEVVSFAKLNRKPGENQHSPSMKQMWKDSHEAGKEFVKKRKEHRGH